MRTLIIGCGDIGIRLGNLLVAAGHEVYATRRNITALPASFNAIHYDFYCDEPFVTPDAVDFVFFTAAANQRSEADYRDVYMHGLQKTVGQIQNCKRVIFISSTSVYGQNNGEWVDEQSATSPTTETGKVILEAENWLLNQAHPATIVRPSGIYGEGRNRLIEMAKTAALPPASPSVYSNRIHSDDLAVFLAHLPTIESPDSLYLATDSSPTPIHEVMAWLQAQLGVTNPDAAPARLQRSSKQCSNKRMLASGFELRYPTFRDGYKSLVESYLQGRR